MTFSQMFTARPRAVDSAALASVPEGEPAVGALEPGRSSAGGERSRDPARGNRRETEGAQRPVLLVDDDPVALAQAASILRVLNMPILQANNGPRALAMALQEKPRLILLDSTLPGLHGFEVCRELKATPETKEIPIILSSTTSSDWRAHEDAQKSFGAEALLAKPFHPDVLASVARDLLFGQSPFDALAGFGVSDARRGRRALERGDAAEAVKLFTSATRAQPYWPEAYLYLGLALDAAGQPYQAVSAYERAAELKPGFYECLEHLAALYERIGSERAARGAWERAMACNPTPGKELELRRHLARLLAPERDRGPGGSDHG